MTTTNRIIAAAAAAPLLLAGAGQALADSRAVYDTPDGEFTVEYRDADNLRIGLPGPERQFLLIAGGEGHVLGRDDEGWYAISADQITELSGEASSQPDVRIEPLGEEEMIAGFVGELYRLDQGDDWAGDWEEIDRIVLSDDARLRGIGQAFERMGEMFEVVEQDAEMVGVGQVDTSEYTLLRSRDMKLKEFSSDSLPDHSFTLPPDVRHRDLMAEAEQAREQAADGEDSGSDEPGWLGRQIRGTGEDARDDAAGETRGEVRDRVRDGVRSLFD